MTNLTVTLTNPAIDLNAFEPEVTAAENIRLARENADLRQRNEMLEAMVAFADAREDKRRLAARVCR